MATQAYSYNMAFQESGIFVIYISSVKNRLQQNKRDVLRLLSLFKKGKIDQSDINRAINQQVKRKVDSFTTASDRAYTLASNELKTGDYSFFKTNIENYKKVTQADLQRVANKYFNEENKSVIEVVKK